jgi:hypothetical protein
MKDKAIELLEEYLESKGIQTHFETDIVSLYEGGPVYNFQNLYWDLGIFARCTYNVEMNSGISTLTLMFPHANFCDCKLITEMILFNDGEEQEQ